MRRRAALFAMGSLLAAAGSVRAQSSGLGGLLDRLTGPAAGAALGNDEIVGGLKEALAQGAERAVSALGRTDGFLGNDDVRVPLPGKLAAVGSTLRTLGQGRYVDDFERTVNRAAERAVPEASAVLGDAIRQLTVEDARTILDGPDDAATRYFREVGEERLGERMLPIVSEATDKAGVTAAYKGLLQRAGPAAAMLGDLDLDRYVTGKTLDGLFFMIAAEEKRIRENPVARSTELLQRVFGD